MKRLLVLLVALGMLVAFTAPANAAKPDKPGKPPFEPPTGATCAEFYDNDPQVVVEIHDFDDGDLEFSLTKEHPKTCFDVTSDAGDWTVDVVEENEIQPRLMYIMIRDSAPGDFCGDAGYQSRSGDEALHSIWEFPGIPASTINACDPPLPGVGFNDLDPQLTFLASARNLPKGGQLDVTVTLNPASS